jgi:ribosome-associated protein
VEIAPGVVVAPSALRFSFTTSSGPGGQNVNKRATRAELRVSLMDLTMSPAAIERLRRFASHRVTIEGELIVESDRTRSQEQNRSDCLERLRELVVLALVEPKRRRKTRPTKGSRERRISEKKSRSRTKRNRGGSGWD